MLVIESAFIELLTKRGVGSLATVEITESGLPVLDQLQSDLDAALTESRRLRPWVGYLGGRNSSISEDDVAFYRILDRVDAERLGPYLKSNPLRRHQLPFAEEPSHIGELLCYPPNEQQPESSYQANHSFSFKYLDGLFTSDQHSVPPEEIYHPPTMLIGIYEPELSMVRLSVPYSSISERTETEIISGRSYYQWAKPKIEKKKVHNIETPRSLTQQRERELKAMEPESLAALLELNLNTIPSDEAWLFFNRLPEIDSLFKRIKSIYRNAAAGVRPDAITPPGLKDEFTGFMESFSDFHTRLRVHLLLANIVFDHRRTAQVFGMNLEPVDNNFGLNPLPPRKWSSLFGKR